MRTILRHTRVLVLCVLVNVFLLNLAILFRILPTWEAPRTESRAATALLEALRSGNLQCTNDQLVLNASTAHLTVLIIPHVPTASVIEIRGPMKDGLFTDFYVSAPGNNATLWRPAIALATNYVQTRRPEWVDEIGSVILMRETSGDTLENVWLQ